MKTADAVAFCAARLAAAGIDEPRREARILLAAALGTTAAGLLATAEIDEAMFAAYLARRVAREPMAYITGRREFWGLNFATGPATLIPRPDSECLIEAAATAQPHATRILDLGTGTGCLLLAALHERPDAFGIGVDITAAAVALAAGNARSLGLAGRAAFVVADWAAPLTGAFELILANPPYIETAAIAGLMPEVSCFEPAQALDGGGDGLDAYRVIFAQLPQLLAPGGTAIVEFGSGQAPALGALAAAAGLAGTTVADLAGHPRAWVLAAQRK